MGPGERALSFGAEADSYHAARPGYPAEAAQHVLRLTSVSQAVEVGAGTGKATEVFARPGVDTTCLEPDQAMAEVLTRRGLPGVEVVVDSFEGWPGPLRPVDLVFAAQTWHWLDRDTACARVKEWLRPGGVLALLWNIPTDRYRRFESVYSAHAPHLLAETDRRIALRDSLVWLDDLEAAGYHSVQLSVLEWTQELTPAAVRRLYTSYSDHIALDPTTRETVLGALEDEVRRVGGVIEFGYLTRIFTGIRG